jgi:hypothetical protein
MATTNVNEQGELIVLLLTLTEALLVIAAA